MQHLNAAPRLFRRLPSVLLGTALAFGLAACFGSDDKKDDPTPTTGVSDALHFAFKTPDWNRTIDCERLDLPYSTTNGVAFVSATSASTNSTFFLTYPKDSSAMVAAANLRRYPITAFGANTAAFELSHKLPLTDGSSVRLVSQAGQSADAYNEIVNVKYDGRDGNYALFKVKGSYLMQMTEINGNTAAAPRAVSGTFHFRVRTLRR
ncbi:hypothetical protein MON38_05270 [Hymenobacter sp. DH14]|uniref:Lipoprotein n=1 Tax=Hymenobacter cyanobacteriorum TaxID=2926463 RepID=A0A9X2AGX9_9BACT|nr:hypothetical protein [Hymenobacter cyanobacteriorum]MCI1186820.1 hypothetical protein [Hymenobacter cyanobacteriorum]